jgi:lysozyme-like protein
LRALLVGLLAFVLVTQAAAAAMQAPSSATTNTVQTARKTTLDEQLEQKLEALRKYQGTVRFFETHRSLLSSSKERTQATAALAYAKRRVHHLSKTVALLQARIQQRDAHRLADLEPKAAICTVFGDDCQEAVAVAWCESHLSTTAQNGQYLGLFQMGSYERRLFGHGPTAHAQALAAHRYFVRSGRDWSPWSCRWAAA